jgi:hypothetical protein
LELCLLIGGQILDYLGFGLARGIKYSSGENKRIEQALADLKIPETDLAPDTETLL